MCIYNTFMLKLCCSRNELRLIYHVQLKNERWVCRISRDVCMSTCALVWGMEPFVVTLLNWTPNFRWFMTRLVGKNGHEKDTTCCYEIGLCVWYMDIIVDPIVDLTISLRDRWKRNENLHHFDLLQLVHLNSASETWNDNLRASKSVIRWDVFPIGSNNQKHLWSWTSCPQEGHIP